MPVVPSFDALSEIVLSPRRSESERLSLAEFQKLLRMVIGVGPGEDLTSDGSIPFQEPGRDFARAAIAVRDILPVELIHVEQDVMRILVGGDFKVNRHLEWRLVASRWGIYAPEMVEDGRWSSAAVPTDTRHMVKDEEIVWTAGYPNASYAYLGTCCAALEVEAQRGSPLADFEKFATGVRKASPEQLAEGLNTLPDALKGATTVIAPILKNPEMAGVVKLQEMLLGDRWRVHGLVQGRGMDEWRCTMVWSDADPAEPGNGLRARSGKCADPAIAFLLSVLKARLIDKGLLRTDRPEAA